MFYQNLVVHFDGCPIESLKDRFVLFGLVKNVSLEGPGLVLLLSLLTRTTSGGMVEAKEHVRRTVMREKGAGSVKQYVDR